MNIKGQWGTSMLAIPINYQGHHPPLQCAFAAHIHIFTYAQDSVFGNQWE